MRNCFKNLSVVSAPLCLGVTPALYESFFPKLNVPYELQIEVPALNGQELPDGINITYDLETSIDGDFSKPLDIIEGILKQTGANGLGALAQCHGIKGKAKTDPNARAADVASFLRLKIRAESKALLGNSLGEMRLSLRH